MTSPELMRNQGLCMWTGVDATAPVLTTMMMTVTELQADEGAQMVQIFDSWASELSPQDFDVFSRPYIARIIDSVRKTHPELPITLFISDSGGLLERMASTKPDCISIHSSIDLQDGIKRIGPEFAVQVHTLPSQLWLRFLLVLAACSYLL